MEWEPEVGQRVRAKIDLLCGVAKGDLLTIEVVRPYVADNYIITVSSELNGRKMCQGVDIDEIEPA